MILPSKYTPIGKKEVIQCIVEIEDDQIYLFHGLNMPILTIRNYTESYFHQNILILFIVGPQLLVNYLNYIKVPLKYKGIHRMTHHTNYIHIVLSRVG